MALRLHIAAIAVLTAIVTTPSSSWADSIGLPTGVLTVTSGALGFDHASDDPFASGQLAGNGFEISLSDVEFRNARPVAVLPEWNPSFSIQGQLGGALRLNNKEFLFDFEPSSVNMRISAPPVRFPGFEDPETPQFTVVYPFRFDAILLGQTTDGHPFRFGLTGRGTGGTAYFDTAAFSTRLQFEHTAATPEPSTLVLLALGLVGGWTLWFGRTRSPATAD